MKKAIVLVGLFAAMAAHAKTVTAPVYLRYDGLFPADFEVHYFVTISKTQEEAIKQIAPLCGAKPRVTDLTLKTELIHNSLPGTASVVVTGTATCVVNDPKF